MPLLAFYGAGSGGFPSSPDFYTQFGVAGAMVLFLVVALTYLWRDRSRIEEKKDSFVDATNQQLMQLIERASVAATLQAEANRELARTLGELRDQVHELRGQTSGGH